MENKHTDVRVWRVNNREIKMNFKPNSYQNFNTIPTVTIKAEHLTQLKTSTAVVKMLLTVTKKSPFQDIFNLKQPNSLLQ